MSGHRPRRRAKKPWTVQRFSGLVPITYDIVHQDGTQHQVTVRPEEPGLLHPSRDPRTGQLP